MRDLQAQADANDLITWDLSADSTACPPARRRGKEKGDLQKEPPGGVTTEPDDHGLGRTRGGLTTKLHLAVEQGQKPLSVVITAGQRGDSLQLEPVWENIRVPRIGPGRPHRRPDEVRADKAYGSRKNRAYLRRCGIRCTIPEKKDQIRNRKKLGARGGRPPKFDKIDYRERHAVECGIKPPQKAPRGGHEIRQTRRPLRGDRAGRSHQRVAVKQHLHGNESHDDDYLWPSTLTTRPLGSRTKNRRTPHSSSCSGCTISAPLSRMIA